MELRQPPCSVESEQSLLGGLLLDNEAYERVVDILGSEDFYRDDHRRIWNHISAIVEAGKPADMVTVAESLEASEDRGKVKVAYLAELAHSVPSSLHIHRYAELVKERAMLRGIAQAASEACERALSCVVPPVDLAEETIAAIGAIESKAATGGAAGIGQAVTEAVELADNPRHGLSTGFPVVDQIVKGMHPGDFVIVAARPSMGKSAFAMNIAEHIAARQHVCILSLEMTRARLAGRALRYHESLLGRDQAVDHLHSLKMHIDDSASLGIGQARVRLRKLQRKHGLSLVVVDYLQLMQAKGENRTQEVSAISRGLKAIAKDLGIVVLAVAQLNRAVETRSDMRPHLADLRESGQIEQDADIIAFLYREDYYKPGTEWQGIAEVIVRKNREGGIGTAYLEWIPEVTRFKTLERPIPRKPEPETRVARFSDFKKSAAGDSAA